jgi:cytochrome c oxidase cbb3-type subunit 3/ubiquinol-cytochrome c reductase cytochrome c subunit
MDRNTATTWYRMPLAALLLCALVVGCEPPGKPNPANKPKMPDQILGFDELFSVNCAGCHGTGGKLGPAPPMNDPLFVAIVPDDMLLEVIRNGRSGTPMPPFGKKQGGALTEEQIKVIADGIKSDWQDDEGLPKSPPAYTLSKVAGVQASPGSREQGIAVFDRACAGCHGKNGAGVEHDGVVSNAINVPAFLALISDQAIRRIIITGRSDLGMPNYAESDGRGDDYQPLTSAEIDHLVALIADWRATGDKLVGQPPAETQPVQSQTASR